MSDNHNNENAFVTGISDTGQESIINKFHSVIHPRLLRPIENERGSVCIGKMGQCKACTERTDAIDLESTHWITICN